MKKILAILFTLLLILAVFTATALAEAEPAEAYGPPIPEAAEAITDEPAPGPGEPMTWAYLATIAGATAATLLIVQFLKLPLDKTFGHIPTRMVAYFIALVLMLVATAFTTGLTAENALLAAVNAFVAALAAMGTYEVTFAKVNR